MIRKFQKELNAGTISLVILAVLNQSSRSMYGYEIAKSLEKLDQEGETMVKQGTLYPILRSLEKNGILSSTVEPSVSGPPRKYYAITEEGREMFQGWKSVWRRTREYVDAIVENDAWLKIEESDHE